MDTSTSNSKEKDGSDPVAEGSVLIHARGQRELGNDSAIGYTCFESFPRVPPTSNLTFW